LSREHGFDCRAQFGLAGEGRIQKRSTFGGTLGAQFVQQGFFVHGRPSVAGSEHRSPKAQRDVASKVANSLDFLNSPHADDLSTQPRPSVNRPLAIGSRQTIAVCSKYANPSAG
jgi:hypothetical protein